MLQGAQQRHRSMLCVGLDPEPTRFPAGLKGDAGRIFDFCARIVDATGDLAIAFKPQIAYFAAHRAEAQPRLEPMRHMRASWPQVPVILDAKRGDIGSTAEQYAREAFERYGADAVTLSPFMGFDSVQPYLKSPDKGAFLLCRTSNPRRRRPAEPAARLGRGAAAAVRARGAAGAGALEPQWATGAGRRCDLSSGDRTRSGARADGAAADPWRRRPGRRRGRHRACRLACRCAHRGEFLAGDPVCVERDRFRGSNAGGSPAYPETSCEATRPS